MKAILANLEEKWGDVESLEEFKSEGSLTTPVDVEIVEAPLPNDSQNEDEDPNDDKDDDDSDTNSLLSIDSNAEDQAFLMDGVEALRDMRCYVDFVDKEVMPLYSQFDGTSAQQVRFEDLWALFRVGDVIHMPTGGDKSGRYHEMWRVYRVKSPEPNSKSSLHRALPCRS